MKRASPLPQFSEILAALPPSLRSYGGTGARLRRKWRCFLWLDPGVAPRSPSQPWAEFWNPFGVLGVNKSGEHRTPKAKGWCGKEHCRMSSPRCSLTWPGGAGK